MKSHSAIVIFCGAVVFCLAPVAARATTYVDPLSWFYDLSTGDGEGNIGLDDAGYGPDSVPVHADLFWPDAEHAGSYVSGSAGVTMVASPHPAVLVSASLEPNGYDIGESFAIGELDYYFKLTASPGYTDATVPVLMNGSSSTSLGSGGGGVSTEVSMTVNAVDSFGTPIGAPLYELPSDNSGPFGSTLDIMPGVEYWISMSAFVEVQAVSGSASASVDPTLVIDPGFLNASGYQLNFSPGIGNSAAAAPLPGTLVLFVSGLLGLGMVLRRRSAARA